MGVMATVVRMLIQQSMSPLEEQGMKSLIKRIVVGIVIGKLVSTVVGRQSASQRA